MKVNWNSEPRILTTVTTTSKTTSTSTATTKTTRLKEKKVYAFAGQRFVPPEEVDYLNAFVICLRNVLVNCMINWIRLTFCMQREPLWMFYESLSKQIPSSEMVEFW